MQMAIWEKLRPWVGNAINPVTPQGGRQGNKYLKPALLPPTNALPSLSLPTPTGSQKAMLFIKARFLGHRTRGGRVESGPPS